MLAHLREKPKLI